MKKVRMALMALAAVSSIGGAFAFSPAAKKNAVTYYAVKTGDKTFHWTTSDPGVSARCDDINTASACTITTANMPTDNVLPAGQTSTRSAYQ